MIIPKTKKEAVKKTKEPSTAKPVRQLAGGATEGKGKYFEATGRRKTAIARVRIWPAKKTEININDRELAQYLPKALHSVLTEPLVKGGLPEFKISAKVNGGGLKAQAYAIRHGLSRALVLAHPETKKVLKTVGLLTRDPRMKERKKPGLKGARRAPQWSKR